MTEKLPNSSVSMRGLPYMAFHPQWVMEAQWFHHADARVVRAGWSMLAAAWDAVPAGSIPSSFAAIARVTGLSEDEVGEHYELLTQGWELREARLVHLRMNELCNALLERHADALQELALRAAVVTQDPELFELVSQTASASVIKGRHLYPRDFAPDATTQDHLLAEGFVTDEDRTWIIGRHRDWAQSKGEMSKNWQASLRNFASKEPKSHIPSRQRQGSTVTPVGGRFTRWGAAGADAHAHNTQAFANARERSRREA